MQAQGLQTSARRTADLSVDVADYFGAHPDAIRNTAAYGIERSEGRQLYRVSYLYLELWGVNSPGHSTGYGGFQVRGFTYLWLDEGRVDPTLQKAMQAAAHHGAYIFNSSVEEPAYAGWLDGFNGTEDSRSYRNWEVEPVARREATTAQPGRIDWTFEVYLEVDANTNPGPQQVPDTYAALAHVGEGIGNPWDLVEIEEKVEAQQEWWEVTFNPSQGKHGAYDLHPPGRSASKERAKRLHEKRVYVNGLPVGNITVDGRAWLAKRYADRFSDGEKYGDNYSKKGLMARFDGVHGQSIRGTEENPGRIAKVDESPSAVYLATAAARPDDFDPVDPDRVDPDREIVEGTIRELRVQDPDAPMWIEVRRDEMIESTGKFPFGKITPPARNRIRGSYHFPGYRTIAERGVIETPNTVEETDDGQAGLDRFGGGGA